MPSFMLAVDIICSCCIIVATVRLIDSFIPSDSTTRQRVETYMVKFMERGDQYFAPAILSAVGVAATGLMWASLWISSFTEILCGIATVYVVHRIHKRLLAART